jgi:6-phosphogluconolactonase (cycloisomerase 2 family)
MWATIGVPPSGSSLQTYEYLYLADQNNANLPGYSINKSSGVLTAIPNWPATSANVVNVAKIANDLQVLLTFFCCGPGAAFSISPTTGILSAVSGTGPLILDFPSTSSSGLYVYSADGGSTGWVSTLNPANGNFTSSTQTSSFPAPVTTALNTVLSPNGNFVYFIDGVHNGIVGYSTAGGALNILVNGDIGTGVNPGDQTYGLTLLPTPNAGSYNPFTPPYLDVGANVIYLLYAGATNAVNNWIMPYKINADGSLSTGTPLNLGTNVPLGTGGTMVGDSTGAYLFVNQYSGSLGTLGINTYTIGVNGTLTYSSGPVYSGTGFVNSIINSENTLLYGNTAGSLKTASINLGTGILSPVSSMAEPCGNVDAMSLDPSESFIYVVGLTGPPNSLCGFTVSHSGVIGAISGQSYPLSIPGSSSIVSSVTVQMASP